MSLRAYARHRKEKHLTGATVQAVLRAIPRGRLNRSVVRDGAGKAIGISDPELADREWLATTDFTKAPAAVAAKAMSGAESDEDATSSDPSVISSFSEGLAKEKHFKALQVELDYKKRVGELVEVKEVESRIVDEFSRVRTKMLGVARKAKAQLPHLTREDVNTIDALVREALEDLAKATDDAESA
jgi:phage terminase Nu1 subunit (DNA packaging protein)